MLRAGNFGSAAVAIPRSHPGGGAPPRPPARPFGSYWVVLRLGRGAGLGASLGRRSRAGSKREPSSRGSSVIYLQASSAGGRSFGIRSFRLRAHVAERICRWPSSAEVGIYVDDRHDCAEGQCYGILNLASVPLIRITRPSARWARRASRRTTRSTAVAKLAGGANVHAAMPVRPFPRPARRARAVSADHRAL